MRKVIMREVQNAIPEAEVEPTASLFETNQLQSIMIQNEQDILQMGNQKCPDVGASLYEDARVFQSFILPKPAQGVPAEILAKQEKRPESLQSGQSSTADEMHLNGMVLIVDSRNQPIIEYDLSKVKRKNRSINH